MRVLLFYGVTGTLEEGIDTSDATAVAGNIMLGKTAYAQGEKVTGTFTIESELSAQEQKLEALETILEGKVGGGAVRANIYVQENEPTKKDGIWLKMSDKTAEYYISDDDVYIVGTWKSNQECPIIPFQLNNGCSTKINKTIYVFGGYTSSGSRLQTAYKYDTESKTWTKLSNVPYAFFGGSIATMNTDIYLFGSRDGDYTTRAYKYDTVNNSYTRLTDIPQSSCYGSAVSIGTDIYLFGLGSWDGNGAGVYKYDTVNNSYTKLTNIPTSTGFCSSVAINQYIYLNVGDTGKTFLKYDVQSDRYIQLANTPVRFYDAGMVNIANDIYIFKDTTAYKYSINTDTFEQLTTIPRSFSERCGVVNIDDIIYLCDVPNTNTDSYKMQIYVAQSKIYETDNTVVISQGKVYATGYNTKLFETNFETDFQPLYGFADAWFYTLQDGLDGTMPVYYGNGTQWINIKNPPQNNGGEE